MSNKNKRKKRMQKKITDLELSLTTFSIMHTICCLFYDAKEESLLIYI